MEDNSADHPYSLVRVLSSGTAYVSGVLPYDSTGAIVTEPSEAARLVVENLRQRLGLHGFTLDDVVKTTVFVTDIAWRDVINARWLATFASPMPARTMVEVRRLPGNSTLEVEAIAQRQTNALLS